MAAGCWSAAFLGLHTAAGVGVTVAALAAGALLGALAVGRVTPARFGADGRLGAAGWAGAAVLLGVVAGASATAPGAVRDAGPVATSRGGAAVRVSMVVRDDPAALRSGPRARSSCRRASCGSTVPTARRSGEVPRSS
jgi:hypothetical protein